MTKENKKNVNKKTFFNASDWDSFWAFFSKIWILGIVVMFFLALFFYLKKNKYQNQAHKLQDSVSVLNQQITTCSQERDVAINFIRSYNQDMTTLFEQINVVKQNVNSLEENERILNLKTQILYLQNQAEILNNQILKIKKTIDKEPTK